jgi:hypothetical protein
LSRAVSINSTEENGTFSIPRTAGFDLPSFFRVEFPPFDAHFLYNFLDHMLDFWAFQGEGRFPFDPLEGRPFGPKLPE